MFLHWLTMLYFASSIKQPMDSWEDRAIALIMSLLTQRNFFRTQEMDKGRIQGVRKLQMHLLNFEKMDFDMSNM